MHRRWRERYSRGLGTVRLVPVRAVRAGINPQPIAVPLGPTPIEPIAIGPEPPYPVAIPQDNSPAARARRARRKLRRLFEFGRATWRVGEWKCIGDGESDTAGGSGPFD